jgi:hypothetical protein
MHDLSSRFLERLQEVDPCLGAVYDSLTDSIFVNATRQGLKVHELTVKRKFAENYEELENRIINKLKECDVWQKFGTGKAYDDYLHAEEERIRREKKKKTRDERLAWFKDNRELVRAAVWNAQHGRTDAKTALPYQTASFSMSAEKPTEKSGFTVIDKRGRVMEHNEAQA